MAFTDRLPAQNSPRTPGAPASAGVPAFPPRRGGQLKAMGGDEAARWLYDILCQLKDGEFVELSDRQRAHLVELIERTLAQYEEATSYPSERPATTPARPHNGTPSGRGV
jgi:hypothetical protein